MAEIISVADPARIVDLHPVDQHERLRRLGAAQRYARHRSGAARPAEAHAGGGGEQVDDIDRPAAPARVGFDDSACLTDLVPRLFYSRRRASNYIPQLPTPGLSQGRTRPP